MSRALLRSHIAAIHSPVDDYWSFYFTTQWASVFHRALSGEDKGSSAVLRDLRRRLAGNLDTREAGTSFIVEDCPRVAQYGSFLTNIQPFLKAWNRAMKELTTEWQRENCAALFNVGTFQRYADKGLLSFLKVACDYYPLD